MDPNRLFFQENKLKFLSNSHFNSNIQHNPSNLLYLSHQSFPFPKHRKFPQPKLIYSLKMDIYVNQALNPPYQLSSPPQKLHSEKTEFHSPSKTRISHPSLFSSTAPSETSRHASAPSSGKNKARYIEDSFSRTPVAPPYAS